MIYKILNFCQNVKFELNLYELIMGLFILALIIALILIVKKLMYTYTKERKIDEHMRETKARIAQVITEIGEYNEAISEEEEIRTKITQNSGSTEFIIETLTMQSNIVDTKQKIKNVDQNIKEGELPSIIKSLERIPKIKKTRAMSMEERWAEFDKKRATGNTT